MTPPWLWTDRPGPHWSWWTAPAPPDAPSVGARSPPHLQHPRHHPCYMLLTLASSSVQQQNIFQKYVCINVRRSVKYIVESVKATKVIGHHGNQGTMSSRVVGGGIASSQSANQDTQRRLVCAGVPSYVPQLEDDRWRWKSNEEEKKRRDERGRGKVVAEREWEREVRERKRPSRDKRIERERSGRERERPPPPPTSSWLAAHWASEWALVRQSERERRREWEGKLTFSFFFYSFS